MENYVLFHLINDPYAFLVSDALMKALGSGKDGYVYLTRTVTVLLQTLLQDEIAEVRMFAVLYKLGNYS